METARISRGMPELQLETLREIQIRIERESRESLREIGTLLVHGRNDYGGSQGVTVGAGKPVTNGDVHHVDNGDTTPHLTWENS